MHGTTPARPEQKHPHIHQIISDALRAATMADTYQDALDITGAALRRIAVLTRGEVRHD